MPLGVLLEAERSYGRPCALERSAPGSPRPIRKFEEIGDFGEPTGRVAFVVDEEAFRAAAGPREWRKVADFDATAELGRSSGFRPVIEAARRDGYAFAAPKLS